MNKKRLLLVIGIVALLFMVTGCTIPMDENGNIVLIETTTKFNEMFNEGIFSAILTYPLAQALNFLSPIFSVGGAIMVVTLGINAIILVFTFRQNVAMQKMQQIQPELQKIQKKYEGRNDQQSQMRMSMEMQNLYKKYNVNPFGALLTSFIQLPILFAVYSAVRRSAAVANGSFLGTSLAITPTQAFSSRAWIAVLIYVLMLVFQFLSIKLPMMLQEKRAKAEAAAHFRRYDKPENNNAMMTYGMLIFIAIIMLSWPTALSLYYMIYSLVNIIKTLVIDKITN